MRKANVFWCVTNVKRIIFISLALIFVLVLVATPAIVLSQSKTYTYTIVVDAGHGGIDGGCAGESGVSESKLNLEYAKTLGRYFSEYGFKVIMTRESDNGLYSAFAKNKKKDDMQKRKQIIEQSNANLVVSIHMNSYPTSSSRGAQVFYNKDNDLSKIIAENIQKEFIRTLIKPRKTALAGDYYIVSCTDIPTVIVECGFLSNIEEEQLLLTEQYREQICYSILCGVFAYFSE